MDTQRERRIADEVDKTLRAFDDDATLKGNPFMAERVRAHLESRARERRRILTPGVAVRYAVVVLILAINAATVVFYLQWNGVHSLREQLVAELKADFNSDESNEAF
jgi:hypothetical protein